MFGFKKRFGDDLLQLAIILSLLRVDLDSYLNLNLNYGLENHEIMLGSSSAYTQSHIHNYHNRLSGYAYPPKTVESMLLNQQSIFYELNLLGRYTTRPYEYNTEVTTYLLNEQEATSNSHEESNSEPPAAPSEASEPQQRTSEQPSVPVESSSEFDFERASTSGSSVGSDLSKEDMDLIEVLLKQDIDLGVTREVFDAQLRREVEAKAEDWAKDCSKDSGAPSDDSDDDDAFKNLWAGLNYTIDSETGEHVIIPDDGETSIPSDIGSSIGETTPAVIDDDDDDDTAVDLLSTLTADSIPLVDPFDLVGLNKSDCAEAPKGEDPLDSPFEALLASSPSIAPPAAEPQDSLTDQLEELEDMIQAAQLHMHPHGRSLQARGVPYVRAISMEQRWQDLANILSLPLSSEQQELHNSLAMVHGPHHNFTSPANTSYGGIDNRSAILLHNASLAAPPMPDINSNMSYHNHSDMVNHFSSDSSNLATAVATSLTVSNNGSEPMGDGAGGHGSYGADGSTLMYPHNQTEMNQTTDGFLSSILNDEDLQLMDMAINNEVPYTPNDRYIQSSQPLQGIYPMRGSQHDDAMDTSSDSAVSSMGSSERVPSITDGVHNHTCHTEWIEAPSEPSHHTDHNRYYSMDYSHPPSVPAKYRPYEYSYATRSTVASSSSSNTGPSNLDRPVVVPPVAQKKYQLFGKRFPADQTMGGHMYNTTGRSTSMVHTSDTMKYPEYPYDRNQQDRSGRAPFEMAEGATAIDPPEHKFSCSMEFARQHNSDRSLMQHVQHNHTYQLSSESIVNQQRPTVRDKNRKKTLEEHISRDEKRARALKVPLNAEEIVNLPMDEFNERLSKFDLTEAQLALIRDIRRRGKNKVAAQNCRKRKLDQIVTLADVVQNLQGVKDSLNAEHASLTLQRQRIKDKFSHLYRHVFQSLRDPDGNPYSPYDYSLQQAPNGNVVLVPRNSSVSLELDPNSGAKAKKKDDHKK